MDILAEKVIRNIIMVDDNEIECLTDVKEVQTFFYPQKHDDEIMKTSQKIT